MNIALFIYLQVKIAFDNMGCDRENLVNGVSVISEIIQ